MWALRTRTLIRAAAAVAVPASLCMCERRRPDTLKSETKTYEIHNKLGAGAFATVRLVTERESGKDYALKLVNKRDSDRAALAKEEEMMSRVGAHRHVTVSQDSRQLVWMAIGGGDPRTPATTHSRSEWFLCIDN